MCCHGTSPLLCLLKLPDFESLIYLVGKILLCTIFVSFGSSPGANSSTIHVQLFENNKLQDLIILQTANSSHLSLNKAIVKLKNIFRNSRSTTS